MASTPDKPTSSISSEMKGTPASIANATRRKFGVQKTKSQSSLGKQTGVKVPNYSAKKMSGGGYGS